MSVSIREANPSDASEMIAFVHRLSDETDINIALSPGEFNLSVEEEEEILKNYKESDNSIFLVAEFDSEIIGVLNCKGGKRLATRHVGLLGLSVDKTWRNQGIGTMLMEEAIRWAKNTGILTRIELQVFKRNEVAIHLYQKFGFVVEGCRQKAIFRNGLYLDDLIMALLL